MSRLILLLVMCALMGCASPHNPSFDVGVDEARAALRRMRDEPRRLARPVVVIGGWADPGLVPAGLVKRVRRFTGDERVIGVPMAFCFDFDQCRRRVMRAVEKAWGAGTEVDVVAFSMGGVVARYAALTLEEDDAADRPPPLRVRRLFTISSPHGGAVLAKLPTFDRLAIDMRPGSPLLAQLDAALPDADYELYPYVRLGDYWVGPPLAAPPPGVAWWVANRPLQDPHVNAYHDPRIVADILLRLRGEPPLTTHPPAPLP